MKYLLIALCVWSFGATATLGGGSGSRKPKAKAQQDTGTVHLNAKPGEYSVVALLTMNGPQDVRLMVNPLSQQSYDIGVKNGDAVVSMLKVPNYFGQVRVVFNLIQTTGKKGTAEVTKIEPVNHDRIPRYEGAFQEIKGR